MGTESISYKGREFNASSSTMEIWLRLLAFNLHPHGDKQLTAIQEEWIRASDNLECFPVALDGLEPQHDHILKSADRLLERLGRCNGGIKGSFINLLGFTEFTCTEENSEYDMEHVIKAGNDFRNLIIGNDSTSSPATAQ